MDQNSSDAAAGMAGLMGVGMILFVCVMVLLVSAVMIWLFYRIFKKAGMAPALSLLAIPLVPFGALIALCILAFGTWKVVPAPQVAYGGPTFPPPGYPPQQNLPPNYPQQGNPPPPGNYPPRY